MKKILILINPHAGTHSLDRVNAPLMTDLRCPGSAEWQVHTHVIEDFDDSRRAVLDAVEAGYYAVAAVGGDGTANSVGAMLRGTDTALGIIPAGSGNGVARHIGMRLEPEQALDQLPDCRCVCVDTLEVNGRFCLGFAGVGFEAAVAHNFARSKHRGLVSYTTSVLSEVFHYQPPLIEMEVDGQAMRRAPFTMTFANSSQWGFDFRIAPTASMSSGSMKLVVLSDIGQRNAVQAAYSLYKGHIDRFPSCETIDARHVSIGGKNLLFHIDGEPFPAVGRLEVAVHPASLRLLTPRWRI